MCLPSSPGGGFVRPLSHHGTYLSLHFEGDVSADERGTDLTLRPRGHGGLHDALEATGGLGAALQSDIRYESSQTVSAPPRESSLTRAPKTLPLREGSLEVDVEEGSLHTNKDHSEDTQIETAIIPF